MNSEFKEELIKKAKDRMDLTYEDFKDLKEVDIGKIIESLSVYEVELEIQNEELRQANNRLENMTRNYIDLYNNAPVGYLLFDTKGIIRKINETAFNFLANVNFNRFSSSLIIEEKTPFIIFIANENHNIFIEHLRDTVEKKRRQFVNLS